MIKEKAKADFLRSLRDNLKIAARLDEEENLSLPASHFLFLRMLISNKKRRSASDARSVDVEKIWSAFQLKLSEFPDHARRKSIRMKDRCLSRYRPSDPDIPEQVVSQMKKRTTGPPFFGGGGKPLRKLYVLSPAKKKKAHCRQH